eukprot:3457022-Amphidinium_carterae.1
MGERSPLASPRTAGRMAQLSSVGDSRLRFVGSSNIDELDELSEALKATRDRLERSYVAQHTRRVFPDKHQTRQLKRLSVADIVDLHSSIVPVHSNRKAMRQTLSQLAAVTYGLEEHYAP